MERHKRSNARSSSNKKNMTELPKFDFWNSQYNKSNCTGKLKIARESLDTKEVQHSLLKKYSNTKDREQISVLDHGGRFGHRFYNFKEIYDPTTTINYRVLEDPYIAKFAKEEGIDFCEQITKEDMLKSDRDIFFSEGTFMYTNPKDTEFIENIVSNTKDVIYIFNVVAVKESTSYKWEQGAGVDYTIWNCKELIDLFSSKFELTEEVTSDRMPHSNHPETNEQPFYRHFVFTKKKD
jgi:putative methyltransferase (TIGR04325 family)